MELDPNNLVTAFVTAGGIWAAIRIEIKYLWRDVELIQKRIEKIEEKKGG